MVEELANAARAIADALCTGATLDMFEEPAEICTLIFAACALKSQWMMARRLNVIHHATMVIENLVTLRTTESFRMR